MNYNIVVVNVVVVVVVVVVAVAVAVAVVAVVAIVAAVAVAVVAVVVVVVVHFRVLHGPPEGVLSPRTPTVPPAFGWTWLVEKLRRNPKQPRGAAGGNG